MLPPHASSGYCDIQGRRRVIEDFHAIEILPHVQFYGIFDGHTGNLASKFVASFLYEKLDSRLSAMLTEESLAENWKVDVEAEVVAAFQEIHRDFLHAVSKLTHSSMDQSGTTATAAFITHSAVVIASLGDSRAVLSSYKSGRPSAIQLTRDHVASDVTEASEVVARGGRVSSQLGMPRVNGTLAITRSIGGKFIPVVKRTESPEFKTHSDEWSQMRT